MDKYVETLDALMKAKKEKKKKEPTIKEKECILFYDCQCIDHSALEQ